MSLKRILKESEGEVSSLHDLLAQYFEERYPDFDEFDKDLLWEDFINEFEYDEEDYDWDDLEELASSYNASFWDILRDVIGYSGSTVELYRVIHLDSVEDLKNDWGEHWTAESDMLDNQDFLISIGVSHKKKSELYVLHGEAKTSRCRFPYSGNKEYPEEKELIPLTPWNDTFETLSLHRWEEFVKTYSLSSPLKKLI